MIKHLSSPLPSHEMLRNISAQRRCVKPHAVGRVFTAAGNADLRNRGYDSTFDTSGQSLLMFCYFISQSDVDAAIRKGHAYDR